jgi:TRAP-type mannitol/chloroaromatic compound transport system permease small subunit
LVLFFTEYRAAKGRGEARAGMERFFFAVDALSAAAGKTYGWSIVLLTFTTSYEVLMRYLFLAPTYWAFDTAYMLYGTLFMMAGAYALSRNGHVRGDFIYRAWPPRRQAAMDLVLYFFFFFPGMIAFIYAGYWYAMLSTMTNEHSSNSPAGPIIWPFKWLIPVTGVLMVLQGVVEVLRCLVCLRTGEWPRRIQDVEELEKVILEEAEEKKRAAMREAEEIGPTRGDI